MHWVGHVLFCPRYDIPFARLLDENGAPYPEMKKDHKEIFQALLKKFEVSYHWQETLAAPSTEFEER